MFYQLIFHLNYFKNLIKIIIIISLCACPVAPMGNDPQLHLRIRIPVAESLLGLSIILEDFQICYLRVCRRSFVSGGVPSATDYAMTRSTHQLIKRITRGTRRQMRFVCVPIQHNKSQGNCFLFEGGEPVPSGSSPDERYMA